MNLKFGHPSIPQARPEDESAFTDESVTVVYCYDHTCPLGGEACAELAGRGYPVVQMNGGFDVWQVSEVVPHS